MYRLYLLLLLCISALCGYTQTTKKLQGLYCIIKPNGKGGSDTNKIWFEDSIVIMEQKAYFSAEVDSEIILQDEYETYKYTYCDLRTLTCEDYFSFSDTANPLYRYKVSLSDTTGWLFSLKKESRFSRPFDKYTLLPDTSISNRLYKRIRFSSEKEEYRHLAEETYYILCDNPINPAFGLSEEMEKLFPGCMMARYDLYVKDDNTSSFYYTEYKIISNCFSATEQSVFDQWKKKAQKSNLITLSLKEIKKRPLIPLKYKDHPFYRSMQGVEWENQ